MEHGDVDVRAPAENARSHGEVTAGRACPCSGGGQTEPGQEKRARYKYLARLRSLTIPHETDTSSLHRSSWPDQRTSF